MSTTFVDQFRFSEETAAQLSASVFAYLEVTPDSRKTLTLPQQLLEIGIVPLDNDLVNAYMESKEVDVGFPWVHVGRYIAYGLPIVAIAAFGIGLAMYFLGPIAWAVTAGWISAFSLLLAIGSFLPLTWQSEEDLPWGNRPRQQRVWQAADLLSSPVQPAPPEAWSLVAKVRNAIPGCTFHVHKLVERTHPKDFSQSQWDVLPDPFLKVTLRNQSCWIYAWEEPDFQKMVA